MKSTKTLWWRCALFSSAVLASTPLLAAENAKETGVIRFKAGDAAVPVLGDAAQKSAAISALLHPDSPRHIVVQFNRPLMPAQRDLLASNGLRLQAPLGNHAFFATLAPAGEAKVADLAAFEPLRSVVPIRREWKLDPLLQGDDPLEWATVPGPDGLRNATDPTIAVYVLFHPDADLGLPAIDLARLYGGQVRGQSASVPFLVVEMPRSMIERLAEEDAVQWIEPALPAMSELWLLNDSNRERTGADIVNAAPYNLDGTGVNVLVYDGGAARATHQTFGGRLTVIDNSPVTSHATHVSGTVGGSGAGSGNPSRAGMAPGVTLFSAGLGSGGPLPSGFLYTNPMDLEEEYALAVNSHGVVLTNNSIGTNVESNFLNCELQGNYGVTDVLIDSIVRGSLGQPLRVVWANGNERQGSRCDIEGFGDYYSVAPPAGAKNHLTVGALNSNDDSMTSFSSWGPTDDGRMKPDIAGPGCQTGGDSGVTSSTSSSDTSYSSNCGTSMAAPTVTGLAALLLQDFRARFPGHPDPRNSTLRALFAHTAEDLFNPGPDYKSGYGSVRIKPAIDLMRTGRMQEAHVGQGQVFSTTINVIPGSPLKVTMAWDDAPGTPNAAVTLVNDLDLRLIDPDGNIHYPWRLDPLNPSADAVRTGPNTLDNIEQVYVDNPVGGTWTVEVVGTNVPQGPQVFSIVGAGQTSGVLFSLLDPIPALVLPGQALSFEMDISVLNQDLVPGSAVVGYRFDGGEFTIVEMTHLGGARYRAVIPAASCDQTIDFYFAATGEVSGTVTEPLGAPEYFYSTGVGLDTIAFFDDFETDQGWTVQNFPLTAAFTGEWMRAIPVPATGAPLVDVDPEGEGYCYVTDNRVGNFDVDSGATVLTSPIIDASGGLASVSYSRWFFNGNGAHDTLRVEISGDGGATWHLLEDVGPQGAGGWESVTYPIPPALATNQFRIRFTASDLEAQAIVEAAVDAVRVNVISCENVGACPADWDASGQVNSNDISAFLSAWLDSVQNGTLQADFDQSGQVNSNDISAFLSAWLEAVQSGC